MDQNKRVAGIVYKKKSNEVEVLCLKRSLVDGGFWQYMTGTPEAKETDITALYREIHEECGISREKIDSIIGPIYKFNWIKNNIPVYEFVFAILVEKDTKIRLSAEHEAYCWLFPKEAYKKIKTSENKKALKIFIKQNL